MGSHFVERAAEEGFFIVSFDNLSSGSHRWLKDAYKTGRVGFRKGDIAKRKDVLRVFADYKPDTVVHFAAEQFVDDSIASESAFVRTNEGGILNLLYAIRQYPVERFLHISTDEVTGSNREPVKEDHPFNPGNPYSATKCNVEHWITSFANTYGNIPYLIARPANNYGKRQKAKNFIPRGIFSLLLNQQVPLFTPGTQKRTWLHVEDFAEAAWMILTRGRIGRTYNIPGNKELQNWRVAYALCRIHGISAEEGIKMIPDRPGHDWEYNLDGERLYRLGFKHKKNFDAELPVLYEWLKENLKFYWPQLREIGLVRAKVRK